MEEPNERSSNNEPIKEAIKQADLPEFPDFTAIKQELDQKAQTNSQHTPRQRGPYLECVSCEYSHTLAYLGPLKKLVGFDEGGGPVIEDIVM